MGKVQNHFTPGGPGTVTRSIDDIIISVRNASGGDIPFGAPVFLGVNGAVPFDMEEPQDFTTFLGFAVRVADKTPDAYPLGQFNQGDEAGQRGAWKSGDVMEVLVRGSIALKTSDYGARGGRLYIRKTDGEITSMAGTSGTTVLLENVRIRNPRTSYAQCCEAVVRTRNII